MVVVVESVFVGEGTASILSRWRKFNPRTCVCQYPTSQTPASLGPWCSLALECRSRAFDMNKIQHSRSLSVCKHRTDPYRHVSSFSPYLSTTISHI